MPSAISLPGNWSVSIAMVRLLPALAVCD
jgi:hypothetical protein